MSITYCYLQCDIAYPIIVSYDTIQITVNQLPLVDAGLDTAICLGDSISLFGTGASIYNWSNTNQLVADGVSFSPIQSGNYLMEGTDINGCSNYDSVNVLVNSLPNVNAGADQNVCFGDSVLLSGSGAVSYQWSGGITDSIYFMADSSGTYSLVGTDSNGCQNTDSIFININPLPY